MYLRNVCFGIFEAGTQFWLALVMGFLVTYVCCELKAVGSCDALC